MFCGLKKKHGGQQTADGRHNAAFTLLELVIVLAIIGLVAVMTVPGFVGMMRGRHLTSAANVIHAALNGAKNVAVTQRKPYGVVFDITAGRMGVYENGDDSNLPQGKVIFLPRTVSFYSNYSLWSLPGNTVVFNPDGSLQGSSPTIILVDRQEQPGDMPESDLAQRGISIMEIIVVRNTGQVIID